MKFKNYTLRRFTGLALLTSLFPACSNGDGEGQGGSSNFVGGVGSSKNTQGVVLVPPQFTYSPATPGRAVGIRAIVEVDGLTLTSEPLELDLYAEQETELQAPGPEELSLRPAQPNPFADALTPSLNSNLPAFTAQAPLDTRCHVEGEPVSEIYTKGGAVSYLSTTYAAGFVGAEESVSVSFYMGRDGIYAASSTALSAYLPPDLAHGSISRGVGILKGNGSGELTKEYLEGLGGISISYSIFWHSVGYTVFTQAAGGLAPGIQYDTGTSFSFLPIALVLPFGVTYEVKSTPRIPLRFIRAWEGACDGSDVSDDHLQATQANLLALVAQGRSATLEDSLLQEFASGALPLFENFSAEGQGGPGNNVPAASNADMFAEFLSSDPKEQTINTSIDGQLNNFSDEVLATEGDTAGLLRAFSANRKHVDRSVPSMMGIAALQRGNAASLAAASELLELVVDKETEGERYIAPLIKTIEVESGEQAVISITAEEIAELVGVQADEVLGATVYVTTGLGSDSVPFQLESASLDLAFEPKESSVLVRIDVDLSTAAGDFPAGVEDWVVRPEMRLVKVKAGAPALAVLAGPGRLPSGGPASLSVQVFDAEGRLVNSDYNVRFVDAEGMEIGVGAPKHGTALLQYVPAPSIPTVHEVEAAQLQAGDEVVSGMHVRGTGFSRESRVLFNGVEIPPENTSTSSPELILFVLPEDADGTATVTVENPGGLASVELEVILTTE